MKLIESKPIDFVDAKKILSKKDEVGYEQKITLEYLRKYVKVDEKDIKTARKELEKQEHLKNHQISLLLALLPEDEDEVKTIFMKERISLTNEQIKKILEVLKNVKKK